jgi:predicted O-methyltransferase YrrM
MCSGHQQGRLLAFVSKMVQPRRILEIGTYTGYSALCLAEGLPKDGHLHSVDNNPEILGMAQSYVDRSEFREQISLHKGKGMEWIERLDEAWDLVFIDADKENYPNYLEALLPKLQMGAVLLADNVLWSGKVADPEAEDAETSALRLYNQRIISHPRLEAMIISVRDGISLARVTG